MTGPDRTTRLLIDVGNRCIKWSWAHDIDSWLGRAVDDAVPTGGESCYIDRGRGESLEHTLETWLDGLERPGSVWVSCVAEVGCVEKIWAACRKTWGFVPQLVETGQGSDLIHNDYLKPGELGVDRWLSMIGARAHVGEVPVLVVDAGTAITVDFLDGEGSFKGGVIFPGLMTMQESLNISTGQIRVEAGLFDRDGVSLRNRTTCDAVRNGILHTSVSAVDQAIQSHCSLEGEDLLTIITGGDSGLISKLSRYNMKRIPGLVLAGLSVVSRSVGE